MKSDEDKRSKELADQRAKLDAEIAKNKTNQAAVAKTIPPAEPSIIPKAKYFPIPDFGMETDTLRHRIMDTLRRNSSCRDSSEGYTCDCCQGRYVNIPPFSHLDTGQCYDIRWVDVKFLIETEPWYNQILWRPNPDRGQVLNRKIEIMCYMDRGSFLSAHPDLLNRN